MLAERVAQWTEKWKQEGLEQGSQQAAYKILAQLLRKRFGPLPSWVEEKMHEASADQLQQWAENVLDAPDLKGIFE